MGYPVAAASKTGVHTRVIAGNKRIIFENSPDEYGVEKFDDRLIPVSPGIGRPGQQARPPSWSVHRP
jgi:hypothetical protein